MGRQGRLADEVRTGLTPSQLNPSLEIVPPVRAATPSLRRETGPLDELSYGKPVRAHVREFAALFALILVGIAGWTMWKGGSVVESTALLPPAGLLYFIGVKFPRLLLPVWRSWMALAKVLHLVMTPFILTVAWVAVVIPIALLLRALRIKVVDTTYRAPVDSYWKARDPKKDDFTLLERQF